MKDKDKKVQAKKNKFKGSLSEKLVLMTFVKVCPKIINLWKESKSDLTFDNWLLGQMSLLDK